MRRSSPTKVDREYRSTTNCSTYMVRSIAVIVWAIGLSQPSMSEPLKRSYAKVVLESSKKHDIDPFTIVAIGWHESRWRSVVSKDGEDYGIMQIRARYSKGCRKDLKSAECKKAKARLLNPHYNIRRAANLISNWRKTCRRLTGRPALFHRWLHGYGGMGNLKKGIICGQKKTKGKWRDLPRRKLLKRIINYRLMLIKQQPSGRRGDPTQVCPL